LAQEHIHIDAMRLCAFPFPDSVSDFIASHDAVFVVEQNRDAQMRSLLVNELDADPQRLISVRHYDGTPITARFIAEIITRHVHTLAVAPSFAKREKVA
jgi:2-oxoglutarate ferredoxin oxidoreductase subunit alpha